MFSLTQDEIDKAHISADASKLALQKQLAGEGLSGAQLHIEPAVLTSGEISVTVSPSEEDIAQYTKIREEEYCGAGTDSFAGPRDMHDITANCVIFKRNNQVVGGGRCCYSWDPSMKLPFELTGIEIRELHPNYATCALLQLDRLVVLPSERRHATSMVPYAFQLAFHMAQRWGVSYAFGLVRAKGLIKHYEQIWGSLGVLVEFVEVKYGTGKRTIAIVDLKNSSKVPLSPSIDVFLTAKL